MTIGTPASHSPDDARVAANRIKGKVKAGDDPVAEKKATAAGEQRKRSATVGRLLEAYTRALPSRPKMRGEGVTTPRYIRDEISHLRAAIADMGTADTPVGDLDISDVRRMQARNGNNHARFGAMSRFLDWCHDAGHIQTNLCLQIARAKRPKAPRPRSRYLTPTELAQLWHATQRLEEPVWREFARFLILVPCRRGEAARMEWDQVDLKAAEWRQPSHLTKNRDPHRLHLHRLAMEVLQSRLDSTGGQPLVFPAPRSGGALDTFTAMKNALADAAGLHGWTWHDFRRSFATALGEAGVPETVADSVLNHRQSATRSGVLAVYQRASRWPEQVKAMELWGRLLAAAIEGHELGPDVVEWKARTA
jgi:integrase